MLPNHNDTNFLNMLTSLKAHLYVHKVSINKIVGILIMLCYAVNASAWTDEVDILGNESCEFNINPMFNSSTVNNPTWLDRERYTHATDRTIMDPFFRSNNVLDWCQDYEICKHVWDDATSSYIKSSCCITISECVTLVYSVDVDGLGYYKAPDNLLTKHLTEARLLQKYYQEMMNAGHIDCAEFVNIDEAGNGKPDVIGIKVTADVGNDNLNQEYTGYVTLTGEDEKDLMGGQNYGFDLDSISGEAGSGDLANKLGWGNMGETSRGHKNSFEVFFYTIIPIIFVLLVMKMLNKVSN